MTFEWTAETIRWIQDQAAIVGFHAAGVASASSHDSAEGWMDAQRFASWVAEGRAGEMEYLKRRDERGVFLRSGAQVAMPWAQSIIVCALNYNNAGPLSITEAPNDTGWIARYAWSGRVADENGEILPTDYHDELLERLRQIESNLQQRVSCETRCYVDTGPLVERTAAAHAGVGWIGKNTCVINQGLGSWLLLGVIVTSLPVAAQAAFDIAADRCGSCTRCIDACPTDALVAPRQMDASRCIAYLTIEKKGTIPHELREPIGRQVFGCDICQDVCPWNRRTPIATTQGMAPRSELINPALEWLAKMDAPTFKRNFGGSPVERTRRRRLLRKVAIAMGNSKETKFLPQLEEWEESEDSVLAESARWAMEQIQGVEIESKGTEASGTTESTGD
jgi:epoxyqueuosine reductase